LSKALSLLDIAPSHETVSIGGQELPVPGVSIDGIAHLLSRFDELRMMLSGQMPELTPDMLAGTGPHLVNAIIAAGLGYPGDTEHEAAADRLPATAQLDLLAAIIKATFPGGMGNAKAALDRLVAAVGVTPMEA